MEERKVEGGGEGGATTIEEGMKVECYGDGDGVDRDERREGGKSRRYTEKGIKTGSNK